MNGGKLVIDVQSDSHDGTRNFIPRKCIFDEDSANLFPVHVNVVRPFDFRLKAVLFQRPAYGDGGARHDQKRICGREIFIERQSRKIHAARRGRKTPALRALPPRLAKRRHD